MNASKRNPLKRDEQSSRCRSSQVFYSNKYAINQRSRFSTPFVSICFVAKQYILYTAKCLKGQIRSLPARNTLVQLLALRVTMRMPIADHTV